ncbi:MAG: membrane dipeptidase, partial [Bacteroidota bacterium]
MRDATHPRRCLLALLLVLSAPTALAQTAAADSSSADAPWLANADAARTYGGGLDGAFFAAYVSSRYGEGEAATERARAMHRTFVEQVAQDERVELARTAADVRRITAAGRRAILWGLEGGHALQGDVEVLREFADLGIRYVTLTHVNTNAWADASHARASCGSRPMPSLPYPTASMRC